MNVRKISDWRTAVSLHCITVCPRLILEPPQPPPAVALGRIIPDRSLQILVPASSLLPPRRPGKKSRCPIVAFSERYMICPPFARHGRITQTRVYYVEETTWCLALRDRVCREVYSETYRREIERFQDILMCFFLTPKQARKNAVWELTSQFSARECLYDLTLE